MTLSVFLPHRNHIPIIQTYEVCYKLCGLRTNEPAGPDEISNPILKQFNKENSSINPFLLEERT